MSVLLELREVWVSFGGVLALQGLSFTVKEGELLGLIGPNGAGKTTAMRVITGQVTPHSGSVRLAGRDLDRLGVARRVRCGLGLSQQLVRPFSSMSVVDNVALAAGFAKTRSPLVSLLNTDRHGERRRARDLLALVGIADVAEQRPDALPLGYLKRLEVARALALAPRVLLLDEPLAGLNQVEAGELADTVLGLNHNGHTVVMIEHNLGEVMRTCSRLVVIDNGAEIGAGVPAEVMADPVVRSAYLGSGDAAA